MRTVYKYSISTNKIPTKYIIYMATSPSNKRYIGYTTQSMKKRMYNHYADSKRGVKYPLHNAINKYGYENILWEIIDFANNFEEIKTLEKYWILKLGTQKEYNIAGGGDGATGLKRTRKQRIDKSIAKGTKPFKVYTINNEYIGEWNSYTICSEDLKIGTGSSIKNCLKNKKALYDKYIFIESDKICDINEILKYIYKNNFIIYDMNYDLHEEFKSIEKCSKKYKISFQTIKKCLLGQLPYFKQYIFLYKDNISELKNKIDISLKDITIFTVYDIESYQYLGT